jgi:hypothetical protein
MIGALAVLAVSATVLLRVDRSHPTVTTAKVETTAQAPAAAPPSFAFDDRSTAEKPASRAATAIAEKKSKQRGEPSQSAGIRRGAGIGGTLTAGSGVANGNADAADLVTRTQPTVAQTQAAPSAGLTRPAAPPVPSQPALADEYRTLNQNAQIQQQHSSAPAQQQQPGAQATSQGETVEVAGRKPATQQSATAKSAQTEDAELRRAPAYQGLNSVAKVQMLDVKGSRWSITADGKLQRATSVGPEGAQWQLVPVDANVVFRVVNATGRDVWAGGNAGALFHSSDGGEHWTRIAPQSGERKLEGDVVSIGVAGPANGIVRVRTSAGQNWISSDGGKSWKSEAE